MKNFSVFYSKVDKIVNDRMSSSNKHSNKGLLAKTSTTSSSKKTDDVFNKVANYVESIRKQKEALKNG